MFIGAGDPASGEFVKIDENSISKQGGGSLTLTGSVTGQVSDISNHDTDDLSEGTSNLYFTIQRARNSVCLRLSNKGTITTICKGIYCYTDCYKR